MSDTALITVTSLPEIQENLRALRERWEQKARDAAAMVCTEENVQTIKKMRADMRKEWEEADRQRKAAKAVYLAPWNEVEEVYRECVNNAAMQADMSFKATIDAFEQELKAKCRSDLERFFNEVCAVHGIDFLDLDQAMALGKVKITLSDAKKQTPRQLQDAVSAVVAKVATDVDRIAQMDEADRAEIMAEYKTEFDIGCAIAKMNARRRRIEAEREAADARKAAQEAREASAAKVAAVATTPLEVEPLRTPKKAEPGDDVIFDEFTFTVFNVSKAQLIRVRDFLKQEGIQYE